MNDKEVAVEAVEAAPMPVTPALVPQSLVVRKEVVLKHNEKFSSDLVTGFIGGFASNGTLAINFFRDKIVLADKMEVEIIDNNSFKEITPLVKNEINRDIFFEAILDVNTTKVFIDWLLKNLISYESSVKDQK